MRSRTLLAAATLVLAATLFTATAHAEMLLTSLHFSFADIPSDGEAYGRDTFRLTYEPNFDSDPLYHRHYWEFDESDLGVEMRLDSGDKFELHRDWFSDPHPDFLELFLLASTPGSARGPVHFFYHINDLFADSTRDLEYPRGQLTIESNFTPVALGLAGTHHILSATTLTIDEIRYLPDPHWDDLFHYDLAFTLRFYSAVPEPTAIIHLAALLIPMSLLRFRR